MEKRGAKKGQITLFILIAVVLLVGAGMIYMIMSKQSPVGGSFKDAIIRDVPSEMVPISSYIDKCILDVAEDALILAGHQGGYTYPEELGIRSKYGLPTSGNAVNHPIYGTDVPYYYFLSSTDECSGDCQLGIMMPFLTKLDGSPSIEGELEKYLERNIETCLDDLNVFRDQGWEIEIKESPTVEVAVAGTDVLFLLHFPFRAKKLDTSAHEAVDFIARVPVNLKKVYEQAYVIWRHEIEGRFLEHHMMNIISSAGYSDSRPNGLPPIAYSKFRFGETNYWVEIDVADQVKDLIERDIRMIQVNGSLNFIDRDIDHPAIDILMGPGMTVPNIESLYGLDITFNYFKDWWNWIYFDVCDGGVCKPKTFGVTTPIPLGYSQYHFSYDISHPVLIEIFDPGSLGHKGYTFLFALESNIRNNRPIAEDYTVPEPIVGPSPIGSVLYCDPNQRTSGNISVTVRDGDGNPLEGVSIIYADGPNACAIGETDENGLLMTQFPPSMGGVITAIKEEYSSYSQVFPTYLFQEKSIEIVLYEIIEVPFTVKGKRMYWDGNDWYHLASSELTPLDDDHIILTLERETNTGEDSYTTYGETWGEEEGTLRLYPGKYNIRAYGIHEEDFTFEDCIEVEDDDCVDISIDFNSSLLVAGLNINYTFRHEDLTSGKDLVIWTSFFNKNHLQDLEDLEVLSRLEPITTIYQTDFYPEWR